VDRDHVHVKAPDGKSTGALPLWMTEEEICRQIKMSPHPYCSYRALRSLREVLQHVADDL